MDTTCMWQVVSFLKNGKQLVTKPMTWSAAYALWERKNSRSKRRFAIQKSID